METIHPESNESPLSEFCLRFLAGLCQECGKARQHENTGLCEQCLKTREIPEMERQWAKWGIAP